LAQRQEEKNQLKKQLDEQKALQERLRSELGNDSHPLKQNPQIKKKKGELQANIGELEGTYRELCEDRQRLLGKIQEEERKLNDSGVW
jgi:predicted RNase H-like nuclease (RuvC/YqgF family)